MTDRVLLVDSDAFVLLSASGLLPELAVALGLDPDDVRCLPALRHQLRAGRSIARRLPPAAVEQARLAAEVASPWTTPPPDANLLQRLQFVPQIDDGEALLLATLVEQPAFLLTTGDKRSLIALGQSAALPDVRDQVRGRIVAVETALVLLVKRLGATEVGQRLQPFASVHRTVDILFGTKTDFDETETLRQITSYLADLTRQIGDDLLFPV